MVDEKPPQRPEARAAVGRRIDGRHVVARAVDADQDKMPVRQKLGPVAVGRCLEIDGRKDVQGPAPQDHGRELVGLGPPGHAPVGGAEKLDLGKAAAQALDGSHVIDPFRGRKIGQPQPDSLPQMALTAQQQNTDGITATSIELDDPVYGRVTIRAGRGRMHPDNI